MKYKNTHTQKDHRNLAKEHTSCRIDIMAMFVLPAPVGAQTLKYINRILNLRKSDLFTNIICL